jgi:hypothetical protein
MEIIRIRFKPKSCHMINHFSLFPQLGWTPISRDGDGYLYKIVRAILVIFWLVIIVTTFLTQILSCFRRDRVRGERERKREREREGKREREREEGGRGRQTRERERETI